MGVTREKKESEITELVLADVWPKQASSICSRSSNF